MTRGQAERLARRFGVHCSTIYRYRTRLDDIGTATAIAGHKRGWKSFASRLSVKQEEVVEQAIKLMRKKAGPLRVVDLVEEVSIFAIYSFIFAVISFFDSGPSPRSRPST
jgi:putative transposase